jgi:hypothetical protein
MRIIRQQQLAHRLLRAVARLRGEEILVADDVRHVAAENRDGRGENDARPPLAALLLGPDGVEQMAHAVEVDPVALLEVGFRLARHDGGQVINDVRPGGEQAASGPWHRQIDGGAVRRANEPVRRLRRDHIRQRQMPDRGAAEAAIRRDPLGELAPEHARAAQNHHMHFALPPLCAVRAA